MPVFVKRPTPRGPPLRRAGIEFHGPFSLSSVSLFGQDPVVGVLGWSLASLAQVEVEQAEEVGG